MSLSERPTDPVSLFYSYSHKDEALRKKLEIHLSLLQDQGVISGWHDRRIAAGTEWDRAISKSLEEAGIILLLVSADFLASRYCRDVEVARAMERHEAKSARVIPVILRPVDWQSAPFGKLQALPKDGKPVTDWRSQDKAFADIARGIREAAARRSKRRVSGRYYIVISATIDEVNKQRAEAIVALLQKISEDADTVLVRVEEGSVRLVLKGSREGFERIEALYRSGQLAQELGVDITDIRWEGTLLEGVFRSDVPARMDRLPWSRWHWLVVIALGITWIIDGLEVTLVGAISPMLQRPETLHFTSTQNGLLNTAYLVGAVLGALVFGYLTDRLGRKKLFTVTLAVYLTAAFLTAFSWDFWSFAVFRFFTGAGIGGEYSAINSAIDELIPARVRGWVDLAINGTFWVGAAAGSLATVVLLDPRLLPIDLGWRLGFGIGALLGLVIIFFRNSIPESPRWLMTRGYKEEAERVVARIERSIEADSRIGRLPPVVETIAIRPHGPVGFGEIAGTMLREYPRRTVLGLTLIMTQAFLYNGVSFTFALILTKFYGVAEDRVGLYLLPFALGNFLGPLLLGRLFDTVGRKPMIGGTYSVSAVLLAASGYLFAHGLLTATTQTLLWGLIFFFASAAASSAYLTVSEIFPLELRGMAIALFYATGTAIGGPLASYLFGLLIDREQAVYIFYGDLLAAALLLFAVVVVALFGVKAERKPLEWITKPLSAADADAAESVAA